MKAKPMMGWAMGRLLMTRVPKCECRFRASSDETTSPRSIEIPVPPAPWVDRLIRGMQQAARALAGRRACVG